MHQIPDISEVSFQSLLDSLSGRAVVNLVGLLIYEYLVVFLIEQTETRFQERRTSTLTKVICW